MADAGSRIITSLEAMWGAIQDRHDEVPDVVLITGTAQQGKKVLWGHHWPDRWKEAGSESRAAELFVAGELLAEGGARTLQTMLHEAAHSLAYVRGIKDTSRSGNRYHNSRFATLAEELGLRRPEEPSKTIGFSTCTITPETVEAYQATIQGLEAAKLAHLTPIPVVTGGVSEPKRAGKRVAVQCGCTPARKIQVTPKQIATGPVVCGLCRCEFVPAAG